jgi:hypothetical protein
MPKFIANSRRPILLLIPENFTLIIKTNFSLANTVIDPDNAYLYYARIQTMVWRQKRTSVLMREHIEPCWILPIYYK